MRWMISGRPRFYSWEATLQLPMRPLPPYLPWPLQVSSLWPAEETVEEDRRWRQDKADEPCSLQLPLAQASPFTVELQMLRPLGLDSSPGRLTSNRAASAIGFGMEERG